MADDDDSKACPFCGETIKKVAIRCKHCHASLDAGAGAEPDFDRHRAPPKPTAPRPAAKAPEPEPEDPGSLPTLLGRAAQLYTLEDWEGAFKIYQTIVVHHRDALKESEIAEIFFRLGNIKLKQGERKKALNMFEKALEIQPSHRPTLQAVIELQMQAGDDEVVLQAKRVLSTVEDNEKNHEKQRAAGGDFDQRFLEFAYKTTAIINAASVAYALKIPIKEAEDRLEDLAARDVLIREVDHEGCVYFRLPGRATPHGSALAPRPPLQPARRGPHPNAVAGLLVNLVVPGAGSLMTGRIWEGAAQLTMLIVGFPLSFIFIGIPILVVAWGWAVATGISAMGDGPRHQPR